MFGILIRTKFAINNYFIKQAAPISKKIMCNMFKWIFLRNLDKEELKKVNANYKSKVKQNIDSYILFKKNNDSEIFETNLYMYRKYYFLNDTLFSLSFELLWPDCYFLLISLRLHNLLLIKTVKCISKGLYSKKE